MYNEDDGQMSPNQGDPMLDPMLAQPTIAMRDARQECRALAQAQQAKIDGMMAEMTLAMLASPNMSATILLGLTRK